MLRSILAALSVMLASACVLRVEPQSEACEGEACAVDASASSDGPFVDAAPPDAPPLQVLERRVAASDDDAEQQPDDTIDITSTDLELVEEVAGNPAQVVGMRFRDVAIEPGATIEAAYVQFQTDELTSVETSVQIRGEASDDGAPFSTALKDISGRPITVAGTPWSPPPWEVEGEAGADQRTPDLAPVLREIVGRPGWESGNALVLVVTGSGKRVAESFDGEPDAAALLHVEFRSP